MSNLFKKVFLAIVLAFAAIIPLSSCATLGIPTLSAYLSVDELSTLREINEWVYWNIEYYGEGKLWKEAQTPQYTLKYRVGVCVDKAYLFMYLAGRIGYRVEPITVKVKEPGKEVSYHALVKYDGVYYDPTNNYIGRNLPPYCTLYDDTDKPRNLIY